MLKEGIYRANSNDETVGARYEILMKVRETEKSYIFELIEFKNRYLAAQMEALFKKSKKVVLRKDRGGHPIQICSDHSFTIYPFQSGVPFYFVLDEYAKREPKKTEEEPIEDKTYLVIYLLFSTKKGIKLPCPRCGKSMAESKVKNAVSRHGKCYVCSECGRKEAILDMAGQKMPLCDWFAVRFLKGGKPIFPLTATEERDVTATMDIVYTVDITNKNINDIMADALEGGIAYWCKCVEPIGEILGNYASDQIGCNGELRLVDAESNEEFLLTKENFLQGLYRFLSEQPYAYLENGEIDMTNIDAQAADTIVQYALFGEVRYA